MPDDAVPEDVWRWSYFLKIKIWHEIKAAFMKCSFKMKMKMKSCWHNNVETYQLGAWLEEKSLSWHNFLERPCYFLKTIPSFLKDSFSQSITLNSPRCIFYVPNLILLKNSFSFHLIPFSKHKRIWKLKIVQKNSKPGSHSHSAAIKSTSKV